MSDTITRLNEALEGRYRIEGELGEGGMATVFLADDLKHERKVALKVLKPELAAVVGADRFLAEIKTTANLQHPHILPLFDSGEADSFLFYVMPYVEGETLQERINREKQLPVDEAVKIATAIAQALHTAHEQDIVHRDIKPANILLSRGEPLVADFGIAIAVGAAGGSRLTETGLSVGTPFYMSPEQATGDQVVGPASDTYALACVLYEMLVGEPPFIGNTAQAVLGKIIQGAPVSATAVRKSIPLNVDAAIRKALEKLPADRFAGADDFVRALADPAFRHGVLEGTTAAPTHRSRLISYSGWAAAVAFAIALAVTAAEAPAPLPVERFSLPFEPGEELTYTGNSGFNLSPDGTMLVYRHNNDFGQVLMVRRWDDLRATMVRETNAGSQPDISPSGEELVFQQGGQVKVLALQGGPVRTLTEGFFPRWGPDGFVYVGTADGVVRVASTGGPVEPVSETADGETNHLVTGFHDDGARALLWVGLEDGGNEIRSLDLGSGEATFLTYGEWPRYALSGHLLYLADGTLMAAPLGNRAELGPAVAVVEGVNAYSISDTGKLFYSTGAAGGQFLRQLMWVNRTGQATPVDPDWIFDQGSLGNNSWRISPDGSSLAITESTEDGLDIWVKRLPDGPRSRLSFTESLDFNPEWTPDGRTVTWVSGPMDNLDLWSRPANGTADAELLLDLDRPIARASWSRDGEYAVLRTAGVPGAVGGRDIFLWQPAAGTEPTPLIAGQYDEIQPELSPDGRWISYASNETGQYEVYVRPFPDVNEDRWQISTDGGTSPRWANSGREIFFMDASQAMVVSQVEVATGFRAETPTKLFDVGNDIWVSDISIEYTVDRDDQRFIMSGIVRGSGDGEGDGPRAILVQNFFEELRRLAPN